MRVKNGKAVQWLVNGAFQVGTIQVVCDDHEPNQVIAAEDGIVFDTDVFRDDSILVKHFYTGDLEFVLKTKLQPYTPEP